MTVRGVLSTVAQASRYAIDGKVDAVDDRVASFSAAVALQQLDLDVIERVDIWKAVSDRARK